MTQTTGEVKEDEEKLRCKIIPVYFDSHVFAYWRHYYPFVPPAYKKYDGHKQAC